MLRVSVLLEGMDPIFKSFANSSRFPPRSAFRVIHLPLNLDQLSCCCCRKVPSLYDIAATKFWCSNGVFKMMCTVSLHLHTTYVGYVSQKVPFWWLLSREGLSIKKKYLLQEIFFQPLLSFAVSLNNAVLIKHVRWLAASGRLKAVLCFFYMFSCAMWCILRLGVLFYIHLVLQYCTNIWITCLV